MTSTLLETHRAAHEKLDRLEMLAAADLLEKPKTQLGKVEQEHKALKRIEEMVDTSKQLLLMYEDADGSRREELSSMAPGSTDRAFEAFSDRLKEMRAYYRRFPELSTANASFTEADSYMVQASVAFSGEEGDGRYLDLHAMHDRYQNLRGGVEPLDYISYLDTFYRTERIPAPVKQHHAAYRDYTHALLDTLLDFFKRAMPLENVEAALSEVERKLTQDRADRKLMASAVATAPTSMPTPAATTGGAEQLPAPSPDGSYFCEACQKPFTKATVFMSHLPGKKHVKAAADLVTKKQHKSSGDSHDVELAERKIAFLGDYLSQVILNTKRNVEKRQSMTVEEKELNEANEQIAEEIEDDDDEPAEELDPKVWNPKGLPLDVTGKPIPYWLWKLHGLGVEYKCEICAGYSYWGIYAFEKHFNEWRHSNAMKILGIPNTKHFMNVTTINEAIALYHKLKQDGVKFSFNPQTEEEFEDRDGNVMPRKIYEDMVRQGLL